MGIIVSMPRKSILDTTKDVLIQLNKREQTINELSNELRIQWKTTAKVLKFLKDIGLVKERKGDKTYREERLFSLK